MSLVNIQGGDILVKSVEIYGSGIVQTTAQTGGVAPPITTGGFQNYSNTIVVSPAVNPAFIASQNVFGGGGLAYMVSMSFGIQATGMAIPSIASTKLSSIASPIKPKTCEDVGVIYIKLSLILFIIVLY